MTWQLSGTGDTWEIKDDGHLVAIIRHCDLPTARLLCAALEMREALKLAEIADFLSNPEHDPYKAIQMLEARGDYETGWMDNDKAAQKYREMACAARQRALRLAVGDSDENSVA